MKLIYNGKFHIAEAKKTLKLHGLSNLFSIIGTGLILLLLGLVIAGLFIGSHMLDNMRDEAELAVYFLSDLDRDDHQKILSDISTYPEVKSVTYINEAEARDKMENILSDQISILEIFDDNPFEAYIEVSLKQDDIDLVSQRIAKLAGVDYIRDNHEIISQLESFGRAMTVLGIIILLAVVVTTVIIVSHMIRQGIYNNREQIVTLNLLGAPGLFIAMPFILAGLALALLGALLAMILIYGLLGLIYAQIDGILPFISLPAYFTLANQVNLIIFIISLFLGLLGSSFGLRSIKNI